MMIEIVNQILSIFTIAGQIIFIIGLAYLLVFQPMPNSKIALFLMKKGIILAFFIALASMLGSLFYSEIAGYEPCSLCWYQRVFMYPQVLLLGLAWLLKETRIIKYSLLLAVIGSLFALYHNYLDFGGAALSACASVSFAGVSCLRRYVFTFGYITIPLMAFTAFTLIILLLSAEWHFRSQINKKQ